jgi:hypothetical protein
VKGGEELDELDRYFASLPAIPLLPDDLLLTEQQADELKKRFDAAMSNPSRHYRYLYKGRWRKALPLPWYTRLRLWLTRKRDGAAIWLCDHGHLDAAEALWLLTGAWRRRAR